MSLGKELSEEPDLIEDRIFLEGMIFYAYHGVDPAEKALGQRFVVDLDVWADLSAAAETDALERTISYSILYRIVRSVVEGSSLNLLESVAGRIVDAVFAATPAQRCRVAIRKPGVAIKGSVLTAAGVELTRDRQAQP